MIYFDIETTCNDASIQFMKEPRAPKNYKDPEKIAKSIASQKQEQIEKAALDPDHGKIIAIAIKEDDGEIVPKVIGVDVENEIQLINWFWRKFAEHRSYSCGYNILGFDLPYLLRRSFALNIKLPEQAPILARYRTTPILDLMAVFYNWERATKGLKWICKRYGIVNDLPDFDGSEVANMGLDSVRMYVANDVYLVYELWKRMKGVYF